MTFDASVFRSDAFARDEADNAAGGYAVLVNGEVDSYHETSGDALVCGSEKFADTEFSVRRVA